MKLAIIITFIILYTYPLMSQHNPLKENIQQPQQPSERQYKRIHTSQQYYRQFSAQLKAVSFSQVVNITHLSNGKEICIDQKPCEFFYYIIKPKFDPESVTSFEINKNNNVKNVAIVAGMHGNQYLGPMSLLYSLKHLESPSTRIIIFPLANPSGFDRNQRLVFPTNIDPNRDFPIEQYTKCYQSSSSLIIDHIYRQYHIDLTLALHNGMSEIGWNWGTVRQQTNSHTYDEPIYRDIGQWLKFVGGHNKDIQMDQFTIGTMNQAIYPVKGAFEDWAYAASWYNGSIPMKRCNYTPYPYNMTNGLVFLFELGPFQVDEQLFGSQKGINIHPISKNSSNGYLSRTIRMLSGLVKVPNPRLKMKFTNDQVIMRLQGCKDGRIEGLNISGKQTNQTHLSILNFQVIGNINTRTVEPSVYLVQKKLFSQKEQKMAQGEGSKTLIIEYKLICDSSWQGKGNTIFGNKRQFKVRQSLFLTRNKTEHYPKTFYPSLASALQSFSYSEGQQDEHESAFQNLIEQNKDWITIVTILLLAFMIVICVIWIICKQIRKDIKRRRIQRLKKKLQIVNKEAMSQSLGQQQLSEISLRDLRAASQRSITAKVKKVESYPQLCESDKSMRNEQLEQVIQLQQFIERYGCEIEGNVKWKI